MRAIGVYVDDTVRSAASRSTSALRYDYSKGYFNSFPILDRNENEIGTSPAVDKLFDWSVISPRLGATVKLNEAGTTLLKGSLGPLLPRHRHRRVRQRHAVDRAELRVLRDSTTPQGNPLGLELVTDNSQAPDRPGVRESRTPTSHRHLRAPARPTASGSA